MESQRTQRSHKFVSCIPRSIEETVFSASENEVLRGVLEQFVTTEQTVKNNPDVNAGRLHKSRYSSDDIAALWRS